MPAFLAAFENRADPFRLRERGSSLRTELVAGMTTFAAMAYILAVNPAILGATGMDRGAVLTATALASALFTVVMGLAANLPIAVAPGMGLNAFFAFTLCIGSGVPWQGALGLVFYGGLLFFLVTITGVRSASIAAIPPSLRAAVSGGIGLFIAFIGLQKAGLVVAHPVTLVAIGKLSAPGVGLALLGLLLGAWIVGRRKAGGLLLLVLGLTLLGLLLPGRDGKPLTATPESGWLAAPPSILPVLGQVDFGYFWTHLPKCLPALFALFFVDLFDGLGTLLGLGERLKGGAALPLDRALRADALGATGCALLGTSTVTPYIESAAGIEQGGRTGLTALATAGCFLLALFAAPLFLAIPAAATAPILILVGLGMMRSCARIDFDDWTLALPACLIVLLMPLTFSIAEGIAAGLVFHVALRLVAGRAREISPVLGGLAVLLLLHYAWRI